MKPESLPKPRIKILRRRAVIDPEYPFVWGCEGSGNVGEGLYPHDAYWHWYSFFVEVW